jgi:hypothetical protein
VNDNDKDGVVNENGCVARLLVDKVVPVMVVSAMVM